MPLSMKTRSEFATQPDTWRRAIQQAAGPVPGLPEPGERVLLLGCGTSYYVAQAAAVLREEAGLGETDALVASELPHRLRRYDRVLAISRSGTSTELLEAVRRYAGTPVTALLGEQGTALADQADHVVDLSYADEVSVVQTRFPTTVLVLLRAAAGEDVGHLPGLAEAALAGPLPSTDVDQIVVLAHGWGVAVAAEAALKVRESAGAWAESYPAGEYLHGPISVAGPRTLVWSIGPAADHLAEAVAATGARLEAGGQEPLVELVRMHRFAVELAESRGRDADEPTHLTRSVVLSR